MHDNAIVTEPLLLRAGYIFKKVLIGAIKNPLKQILGTLLEMVFNSITSKSKDGPKFYALTIFTKLFTKNKTKN